MKRFNFNQISKILLIVVAIIGLTIGMSTITGVAKADSVKGSIFDDSDDTGKCGGDKDEVVVSDKVDDTTKADVKDAKCGEGKCGEGKCGGDNSEAVVSDKVDDATKADVKDAKCGEGKCG
jgi:uncharacterized low-complexity protein